MRSDQVQQEVREAASVSPGRKWKHDKFDKRSLRGRSSPDQKDEEFGDHWSKIKSEKDKEKGRKRSESRSRRRRRRRKRRRRRRRRALVCVIISTVELPLDCVGQGGPAGSWWIVRTAPTHPLPRSSQ